MVRTRIAPSPTGELHIGHVRTILYDYALAKRHGGQFVVRVEDTDRTRFVEGAMDRTLDTIAAYNLPWDEGPRVGGKFAPYIQSERLDIYKKYAEQLVKTGHAYYCFCTETQLEEMRKDQQNRNMAKTMYDGTCSHLSESSVRENLEKGMPYTIRLRVPKDEQIKFHDEVYGDLLFDSNEVDDCVLLKSDGFPTYHLAVVIDDHLMEITHILRGNDWLPSAPKHVLLYKAFGWNMPVHAHLPNLKDKGSTKKLSKRYGDVNAASFLQTGYLPEALLNFLMFLGWNPGGEQEIFSLSEFVEKFSLDRVHKTDLVVFDREKLLWYNGHYIRALSASDLYTRLQAWAHKFNVSLISDGFSEDYNINVLKLVHERIKVLSEYNELVAYFYKNPEIIESSYLTYVSDMPKVKDILTGLHTLLAEETIWEHDHLKEICIQHIKDKGYTNKEALMTLRIALTGRDVSPQIFDMLLVFGKEETLKRISSAISR